MKKTILIFAFVLGTFAVVNAQAPEGFHFGAGARIALPIGDFADSHSLGIGAEVQAEYGFGSNMSGIATTGYTSFFGKDISTGGNTYKYKSEGFIPILVGARYYPSTKVFVGGQVGLGIYSYAGNSTSGFNWQPQVGYNADNFQVALNYNGFSKNGSSAGHIGLTGIFKFGGSGK